MFSWYLTSLGMGAQDGGGGEDSCQLTTLSCPEPETVTSLPQAALPLLTAAKRCHTSP